MNRSTKLFVSVVALCLGGIPWSAALGQTQNAPTQNAPTQNAQPPRPGSINYIEGQAALDGRPLSSSSVGSVEMNQGQTLTTQMGRVEVLLTPGVFLRLDNNSAVKMVNPDLANTEFEVDKGRAMVEAADISKLNNIHVDLDGANIRIDKKGLYDFDAEQKQVRAYKGKLEVDANGQKVDVGEHRMVELGAGGKLEAHDFNDSQYADDFYRWSGLRSGYLAEADADQARLYMNGGGGWGGAGWYWDPWFDSYTFLPGGGIYYSPFGWGFYSPFAVWGTPFAYGGFYGHYHNFGDLHAPYGHGFEPRGGFRGGFGGGLHGGVGRGGGGFHGGGGGFHGGGRR